MQDITEVQIPLFDLAPLEVQPDPQPLAAPMELAEANKIFHGTASIAASLGSIEPGPFGSIFTLETPVFLIQYFGGQDKVCISLHDGTVVFTATATAEGVATWRWRQVGFAWRSTLGSIVRTIKQELKNRQ